MTGRRGVWRGASIKAGPLLELVLSLVVRAQQMQPAQVPSPTDPAVHAALHLPGPAHPKLPTLFLVGDSTVRNGHGDGAQGQWGWGEPLVAFFDSSKINVVNRAIGGRSSRTYLTEGAVGRHAEADEGGGCGLVSVWAQ